MNLAIKKYEDFPIGEKPAGIPNQWVALVVELGESTDLPEGDGWELMTSEELSTHTASYQASYNSWLAGYNYKDVVRKYLADDVKPFVDNLLLDLVTANLLSGITQHGKAGNLLSLFEARVPIASNVNISLKGCFDTGSLYEALKVLQYYRNNPLEYQHCSPFITDAILLRMKNDIERFLKIGLSV